MAHRLRLVERQCSVYQVAIDRTSEEGGFSLLAPDIERGPGENALTLEQTDDEMPVRPFCLTRSFRHSGPIPVNGVDLGSRDRLRNTVGRQAIGLQSVIAGLFKAERQLLSQRDCPEALGRLARVARASMVGLNFELWG